MTKWWLEWETLWVSGPSSSTRIMSTWIIPITSQIAHLQKTTRLRQNKLPAKSLHMFETHPLKVSYHKTYPSNQTNPNQPQLSPFSPRDLLIVRIERASNVVCAHLESDLMHLDLDDWIWPNATWPLPTKNTPRKESPNSLAANITKTPRFHWSPICPVVPTWCHWWCTSLVGRYVAWWRFSCQVAAAELIQAFYGKSTKPPGLTNPRPASKIRRLIKSLFELRFDTLTGPGGGWLGHKPPSISHQTKTCRRSGGDVYYPWMQNWSFVKVCDVEIESAAEKWTYQKKTSKFKVLLSRMEFSIWKKMIWSASC